ncbi:aminotransferase class I/II-fold pyridoxal phosphate-dependent enzyme [Streptomyces niveus]|uniref:aminotransferase class I/II-fold pyridoxal phosphate-dependent enzyme n=1 Tax=Streptomyces niveus TaxID=193462 RepID=UPI0036AD167B
MRRASVPRELRQGGCLTGLTGIDLDLSLCANPYGPSPAALAALDAFDYGTLVRPPYEAAEEFLGAYAAHLGVSAEDLIPGRGVTEFITLMSALLRTTETKDGRRAVAIVTPEYSGTLAAFDYADLIGLPPAEPPSVERRLELVGRAMQTHRFVVISNPNNPYGLCIPSGDLLAVTRDNPRATLIVDEEYVAFDGRSLAGADIDNLVIWQSTGKGYGLVGLRAGIMWTRDRDLHKLIRPYVPKWPLSAPASAAAVAALADPVWLARTLQQIRTDTDLLEELLKEQFGAVAVSGTIHFRFVRLGHPQPVAAHLEQRGIAVRTFDSSTPGHPSGIRILAPTRAAQHDQLSDAIHSCPAEILPR